MSQGFLIGPGLRDAIKTTINRVAEMPYREKTYSIPTRFEDVPQPVQKLKRGTYTGSWPIGATREVTLVGSTQTYAVTNYCIEANGNTATVALNVIFGSVMGTQTAIEIQLPGSTSTCSIVIGGFNLSTLPNYQQGQTQLLGHESGCLKWFSVTACGTTAA